MKTAAPGLFGAPRDTGRGTRAMYPKTTLPREIRFQSMGKNKGGGDVGKKLSNFPGDTF